jgi:hypothetical protein
MKTIRISVKGDEAQSRSAIEARGIQAAHVATGRFGTFWDVPGEAIGDLVQWFCEAPNDPPEGGFPPGTLLHHN